MSDILAFLGILAMIYATFMTFSLFIAIAITACVFLPMANVTVIKH